MRKFELRIGGALCDSSLTVYSGLNLHQNPIREREHKVVLIFSPLSIEIFLAPLTLSHTFTRQRESSNGSSEPWHSAFSVVEMQGCVSACVWTPQPMFGIRERLIPIPNAWG